MIEWAHQQLIPLISDQDTVLDMTMGHGHDTLFLALHAKHVYAFDVQEEALASTKRLLKEHDVTNVTLIHDSHEQFHTYVTEFKGAIFNLGYLPKSDKSIKTDHLVTLRTLVKLIERLTPGGFIQLVVYEGHPEGLLESEAIQTHLSTLDSKRYAVYQTHMPYQTNKPPMIWTLIKK